jgi:putative heme-binding domain-containing protein
MRFFRPLRVAILSAAALAAVPFVFAAEPDPGTGRPPLVINTDPKPPVSVEGWKVETVLMSPNIESPSVVCALPDGRVLIGEDPLDNKGGKEPVDRILCLWPDGHTSVWSDHMYPVFGMAYIDGKVYVHQFPILSVYDDDDAKGVGTNRKDLISHTGKPTIGGLNDHIPAQIRLAMDGYLYLDTGDRGIWQCKSNVDGKEIELAGGGLARLRPDGTGLEVYCTGTRNHLDVSMTSEDEKFTYDNTDDGHGWWTRFTHMVDGGFYGYPWDYKAPENKNDPYARKAKQEGNGDKPYQPYTLWRAAEYGGGSPTGAIGYTEDALPPEYHDNLFHCEWGKGKVQRFVVERDGGTFKVAKMEDFLKPGGDLRPLGIDVTNDGKGFWVTDWGYGGWHQKKPMVGRLIKVTWTGKDFSTPKPKWYVPAAMGKKFEATTAELIEGLKHPSKRVRMVAQRRLVDRLNDEKGEPRPVERALEKLIDTEAAPDYAKWHALWVLERGPNATGIFTHDFITTHAIDPNTPGLDVKASVSVRRQALRCLGESGQRRNAELVAKCLADRDASIRFYAATALGRMREPKTVPMILSRMAEEQDLFTRFSEFTALRRIGLADSATWSEIVTGLESKSDAVRENTTYAFRNTYDPPLVAALVKEAYDKTKPSAARSAALLSAAELHRQPKPWGGNWWGTQPVGSPRPKKDIDWEGTTSILALIRDSVKDDDAGVRAAALKAMTIAPDPAAANVLVELWNKNQDAATRQLILQALAPSKSPKAAELATAALKDPKAPASLVPDAIAVVREAGGKDAVPVLVGLVGSSTSADVLEPAIDTLGRMKAADAVPAITKHLASEEPRVWNAAVNALQAINNPAAVDALIAAFADKRTDVRKAAVVALGQMKAHAAVPAIVEGLKQKKFSGDATKALTQMPDVKALDVYLASLGEKNFGAVRDARGAIEKIRSEALPLIEQKLEAGQIKPEAIAVLQEIYGNYTPITQWQIIGPFPGDQPDPIDASKLTKAQGDLKTPQGATLAWKKVKGDKEGMVDLGKEIGGSGETAALLFAEVQSKSDREVTMQFGSDDTHTVWLNGEKIAEDLNSSGWKADEQTVKAKLKAGKNIMVIRCGNHGGGWQISAAVAAERSGKLFEARPQVPVASNPKREEYEKFATAHKGDTAKGKIIFIGQTASCIKCHQVSPTEGGLIGPSLVGVGAKYDRAKLVESVLYPSKQIFDGFQQTIIKTKDDDVIAGIVKSESDSEITLYDSAAQKIVVKKSDVKSRKVSELSAMPEGLEQAMSPQDFADLISYLETLKEGGIPSPAKK